MVGVGSGDGQDAGGARLAEAVGRGKKGGQSSTTYFKTLDAYGTQT